MTKYRPQKHKFDEVMTFATDLAQDKKGLRKGCIETQLFLSVDAEEIRTLSFWESREAFDTYLDIAVKGDALMEFQSTYLREEIQPQIFDPINLRESRFLPQDNTVVPLRIS
ncbi:antibiotic biosynthesis monooxygenase [Phaeobacter sp. B1627]|uniref:antibiotic biosynthesis monooxygenase n=1 Tax=Phaeobacter sp. B1627 TaxID=2583809 RepID=UPI00159ED1F3|nr:antibiotic biosynthesis monooxygenase [Phaeobacter sp. B1627]